VVQAESVSAIRRSQPQRIKLSPGVSGQHMAQRSGRMDGTASSNGSDNRAVRTPRGSVAV
jgi:hypothetical protein